MITMKPRPTSTNPRSAHGLNTPNSTLNSASSKKKRTKSKSVVSPRPSTSPTRRPRRSSITGGGTIDDLEDLRGQLNETTLNTQKLYQKHLKSPRRNSLGANSSSYLRRPKRNDDKDRRRNKIRDAMSSGVDSILGGDASGDLDVSFKEEDSYLKRLLKNDKTFKDIDKPKMVRKHIHQKKKTAPAPTIAKPKGPPARSYSCSSSQVRTKTASSLGRSTPPKRMSYESAPSKTSTIATTTKVDYTSTYKPKGNHTFDLTATLPKSSSSSSTKVRFAKTGEMAYVDELLEDDFEALFYTDEE
eukprot:scaffold23801_cov157-Cylindrotheca_fusiformis.AAC.1